MECDGFTEFDCTDCIDGLVKFTLPTGRKICVDRNCDRGDYFDKNTASCESCSAECENCDGPTNSECITCSYTHQDYGGVCLTCEAISVEDPKYASTFNIAKEKCDEICGDGFNMGVNACDDGNSNGGDGCSAICTIER